MLGGLWDGGRGELVKTGIWVVRTMVNGENS